MKGKLARVRCVGNLYKYQVNMMPMFDNDHAFALTDDLVIIINTDCHSADEYLVHHQKLSKQYYISKWALEVLG